MQIDAIVGAPVSRSVTLAELPDQTGLVDATFFKYAMVADDVVVVDPIRLRVVDVIRGNTGHELNSVAANASLKRRPPNRR